MYTNSLNIRLVTIIDISKRKSIAILISFLAAIFVSRLTVILIENNIGRPFLGYNVIGDFHVHHFTYGIIILAVNGFVALFVPNRLSKSWLYILYGIGLGLIFDEFGIWLKLDSQYNSELSVVAVFTICLLLTISAFIEHLYRTSDRRHKHKKTSLSD